MGCGVNISSFIGIDLSSRTGHTSSAYLRYNFDRSGNLCGSNGLGPGTSLRVQSFMSK